MDSGSSVTTPASKRTTEEPTTVLGEIERLEVCLFGLGWQRVGGNIWVKNCMSESGFYLALIPAVSWFQESLTSGATPSTTTERQEAPSTTSAAQRSVSGRTKRGGVSPKR